MKRNIIKVATAIALSLALTLPAAAPAAGPATTVYAAKKKKKVKVKTVNRAQVITNIWNLAGKPASGGKISIPDVKKSASYYKAVRWAVRTGILKDNKKFVPTKTAVRQELVYYLWKYAGSPTSDAWKGYSDEKKVAKSYVQATRWAKNKKVLKGVVSQKITPAKQLSATELKKVIANYKAVPEKEAVLVSGFDNTVASSGIAIDKFGAIIITDTWNKRVWRIVNGAITPYAGMESVIGIDGEPVGGNNDGNASEALFKKPWAVSPFRDGWAVSDADNGSLRLINGEGVKTINGSSSEGLKTNKNGVVYDYPTGLATDDAGNLYIADTYNNAIRKMTSLGDVTTFKTGLSDPMGLAYSGGYLYVAETGANRIIKINTNDRSQTVVAGSGEEGFTDGAALEAEFSSPYGVTVAGDGSVYVADTVNGAVRKIKNGTVTTILNPPGGMDLNSWPASPTQLAIFGKRLYVTDNFAKQIYALNI